MKIRKGLFLLLLLTSITGCNSTSNSGAELSNTHLDLEDKYRTYYEIFASSYYDSDDNGFGDLNGITEKLDYIEDLGFNGLWLMPIFEGGSYHKYDVIDYMKIDTSLGTMSDLKNLISEAHSRDITVILDLVVNHTSNRNERFTKGIQAFKNGGGEYSDYYNFSLEETSTCNVKDNITGVYYEAKFSNDMPDLNLDSQNVRNEIKDIMKYYLDIGVDGFRLDAVTSFYTGNQDKNIEFLTWINDTAKSINPNCYLVGEARTGSGEINRYYTSGIDGFFAYDPDALGKRLSSFMIREDGQSYYERMNFLIDNAGDGVPAPFITNHDNPRAVGVLNSKATDDNTKFGQGLLQMLTGTTFTYYGDEIGMIGVNPPDENVRTAMYWSEENKTGICRNPSGTTKTETVYDPVDEQLKDEDSILNYYKKANYIRNKYEAIRKGSVEQIKKDDDISTQILKKTYADESVYLLINFNKKDELAGDDGFREIDISSLGLSNYSYHTLVVDIDNDVKVSENKFTLPNQSIVVISENK